MSNKAISLARKVFGISSGAMHQLLLLADHANKDWKCWPEQKTLASDQCVSVDTVQRRNAELEQVGLISRQRRGSKKGGRGSDIYTLHLEPNNSGLPEGERPQPCGITPAPPCGVTSGVTPQTSASNTAIVRLIKEPSLEEPSLKTQPPSGRFAARSSVNGCSYGSAIELTANAIREYIELYGTPTIYVTDLIRRAAANGDAMSGLGDLIDVGLLGLNEAGDSIAITENGRLTKDWSRYDYEEIWPAT